MYLRLGWKKIIDATYSTSNETKQMLSAVSGSVQDECVYKG